MHRASLEEAHLEREIWQKKRDDRAQSCCRRIISRRRFGYRAIDRAIGLRLGSTLSFRFWASVIESPRRRTRSCDHRAHTPFDPQRLVGESISAARANPRRLITASAGARAVTSPRQPAVAIDRADVPSTLHGCIRWHRRLHASVDHVTPPFGPPTSLSTHHRAGVRSTAKRRPWTCDVLSTSRRCTRTVVVVTLRETVTDLSTTHSSAWSVDPLPAATGLLSLRRRTGAILVRQPCPRRFAVVA